MTFSFCEFFAANRGDRNVSGLRHLCFHRPAKWLYAIQEEVSTVMRLDNERASDELVHHQTISTLPTGFSGSNVASTVMVMLTG